MVLLAFSINFDECDHLVHRRVNERTKKKKKREKKNQSQKCTTTNHEIPFKKLRKYAIIPRVFPIRPHGCSPNARRT